MTVIVELAAVSNGGETAPILIDRQLADFETCYDQLIAQPEKAITLWVRQAYGFPGYRPGQHSIADRV